MLSNCLQSQDAKRLVLAIFFGAAEPEIRCPGPRGSKKRCRPTRNSPVVFSLWLTHPLKNVPSQKTCKFYQYPPAAAACLTFYVSVRLKSSGEHCKSLSAKWTRFGTTPGEWPVRRTPSRELRLHPTVLRRVVEERLELHHHTESTYD